MANLEYLQNAYFWYHIFVSKIYVVDYDYKYQLSIIQLQDYKAIYSKYIYIYLQYDFQTHIFN